MLLEIDQLHKHFQQRGGLLKAVDGVSFSIAEKEILGLVGESGSGKSTLGKLLVGLTDKTSGTVRYQNNALPASYRAKDFRHFGGNMQMIFQDADGSLNPRMTIGESITEPLVLRDGMRKKAHHDLAAEWLTRVQLDSAYLNHYPHELSGGQRQRVGIARALITQPKFVVCDEPISALDVSIQAQVVNLLGNIQNEMNLTILFIAHDLQMVRYISHRMAVMYLGAIVEIGPANEVFSNPRHPYTQLLINSILIADPQVESQLSHEEIKGEMPSPINIPHGCRFASRCPRVQKECLARNPELNSVDTDRKDHLVACFYPIE